MLINANDLASSAVVSADVCIVGSGPAGLTLARELRGQPFKVVVVESGDFRARRKLKQLNEGESFGDHYPNPRWGRVRQVGGAANRWLVDIGGGKQGARYAPLDPIDFEKRDFTPHSGWPISRADLEPFYERAQKHCGLGAYRYDTDYWREPGFAPLPATSGGLETSMFQFGPKDVWTRHHDDVVSASPNIDVLINASVIEVETDEGGENVTGVRAVNEASQPITVRAKQVILAVGCIETNRILLNSRATHASGLGNQNDVVGRYFMDHPQAYLSVFTPSDKRVFDTTGIYDIRPKDGFAVMAKLAFSAEALRREQLQNICYVLFPRRDHFMSDAFQSFFTLALDIMHASRPRDVGRHMTNMIKGLPHLMQIGLWWLQGTAHYPYLSQGGWANIKDKSKLFTSYELWSMTEQVPDPENRITLSQHRDYNGTPKIQVHWRFTSLDRENALRTRQVFTREIERSGMGTVTWVPEPFTTPSSVHPIGGARMSVSPREGVVDPTLKVHGVNNLYLASSAVFPTAGYANPTLTVVALSCRIADQVKRNLRVGTVVQAAPREMVLN